MRRGFSLLELLVATGILSTALLLMIGVFLSAMRGNQKAVDLTAGAVVAESVLTQIIYETSSDPARKADFFDSVYDADTGSPYTSGVLTLNRTPFNYVLYAPTVLNPGPYDPDGNKLKRLEVVVWWWQDSSQSARAGYGQLRTDLVRLVNQN